MGRGIPFASRNEARHGFGFYFDGGLKMNPLPLVGYLALFAAAPAFACPATPIIGTVCVISAPKCPVGFIEADGRELDITGNEALYSLIQDIYGGSADKFKLPDLRTRVVAGVGLGKDLASLLKEGEVYGAEVIALTEKSLPAHTHGASFTSEGGLPSGAVSVPISQSVGTAIKPTADTSYLSKSPGSGLTAAAIWSALKTSPTPMGDVKATPDRMGTVAVSTAGRSQALAKIEPQVGVRHCLAVTGIYPERP
jgi:microcystin-dependent protein